MRLVEIVRWVPAPTSVRVVLQLAAVACLLALMRIKSWRRRRPRD